MSHTISLMPYICDTDFTNKLLAFLKTPYEMSKLRPQPFRKIPCKSHVARSFAVKEVSRVRWYVREVHE